MTVKDSKPTTADLSQHSLFSLSMSDCQWLELDDPSTGRKFYANKESGERQWTMPEEYRSVAALGIFARCHFALVDASKHLIHHK